ncbi:MAG: exodeoxyribonuclease III [Aestuariivirga sp.]
MRVATWNVNSVKAHLEVVTHWLGEAKPDVLCLQEIKCETQNFPTQVFEDLNYRAVVLGQKTYNGVAILSRLPLENIVRGFPGDTSDEQARFIQATVIDGSRSATVASLYLPNGNPTESPKYTYKLDWMDRLTGHAKELLKLEEPFVLAGDYNVIPEALDAKTPSQWVNDALFLPKTRAKFRELAALGLTDAFRALHPAAASQYTFFDYQAGAWQRENGIRIDHMMLSPQAADRLVSAHIEKHVRGWEKPSDHVPVVVEF